MAIDANLAANARFAPAAGLPFTLWAGGETVMQGVIPKGAGGVSATVYTAPGVTPAGDGTTPTTNAPTTADVTLALYAAPTTVNGSDGLLVGTASAIAGLSSTSQTITVSTPDPTTNAPAVYVWRLSVVTTGTNGVVVTDLEMT